MSKLLNELEREKILFESEKEKNFSERDKNISESAKIKAETVKINLESRLIEEENNKPFYRRKGFIVFLPNFALWSGVLIFVLNWVIIPASQLGIKRAEKNQIKDSIDLVINQEKLRETIHRDSVIRENYTQLVKKNGQVQKAYNKSFDSVRSLYYNTLRVAHSTTKEISIVAPLGNLNLHLNYPTGTIPLIFATISGVDVSKKPFEIHFLLSPNQAPINIPYGNYRLVFRDGSGFNLISSDKIIVNQETINFEVRVQRN